MKKTDLLIALAVIILMVSGCASQQLTNRKEEIKTYALDFRPYGEKGFMFMPDAYFGEYKVKGMISAELHPEVQYREGRIPDGEGYSVHYFFHGDKSYTQIMSISRIEDLIEHIYQISISWGGDAFTHFKSDILTTTTDENPNTTYAYFTISGLVIKRQ